MLHKILRTKSVEQLRASAGDPEHALKKNLRVFDLVMFGIGAIIGAGIFSSIGSAAGGGHGHAAAGPAIVISFLITGIACGFTGLCYAELASMIPISGSAYTYAYATLGELMAWIIGWDLLLEYAVSNVAVAISWADYFNSLLTNLGIVIPRWLTTDPRTALSVSESYLNAHQLLAQPPLADKLALLTQAQAGGIDGAQIFTRWEALSSAPMMFGFPVCINVLAIMITLLVTWLCFVGIKESANANTVMVVIKLVILMLVVVVGARFINPQNYADFAPNGLTGILNGAGIIFFAFIGFDAVSTTAEECQNPTRDLPRGIIWSLLICTAVYILVAVVVTGMLNYKELAGIADPLAYVFDKQNLTTFSMVVSVGAVIATTAALLVYQLGQPRIFLAMSRDGLLGRWFGRVSEKYGTPSNATLLTGALVALPAGVLNIDEVIVLTNIGTLFAFAVVCLGVLILRVRRPDVERKFSVPAVWICAPIGILSCIGLAVQLPLETWGRFVIWLAIGLLIYFLYGAHQSVLGKQEAEAESH